MWREWLWWTLLRGIFFFGLGMVALDAATCVGAFAAFSLLDVVALRERMERRQRFDVDDATEALWRSRRR